MTTEMLRPEEPVCLTQTRRKHCHQPVYRDGLCQRHWTTYYIITLIREGYSDEQIAPLVNRKPSTIGTYRSWASGDWYLELLLGKRKDTPIE